MPNASNMFNVAAPNTPYLNSPMPIFYDRQSQVQQLQDPWADYSQMTARDNVGHFDAYNEFIKARQNSNLRRSSRANKGLERTYQMMPRVMNDPMARIFPTSTKEIGEKLRLNDSFDQAKMSSRQFDLFDNAPFIPSVGDVGKDPRYAIQTKNASGDYQLVQGYVSVFKGSKVAPTGPKRPNLGTGFEPYSLY